MRGLALVPSFSPKYLHHKAHLLSYKRLTDKHKIYKFRTETRLPCSGARDGSGGTRSGHSRPRPGPPMPLGPFPYDIFKFFGVMDPFPLAPMQPICTGLIVYSDII